MGSSLRFVDCLLRGIFDVAVLCGQDGASRVAVVFAVSSSFCDNQIGTCCKLVLLR